MSRDTYIIVRVEHRFVPAVVSYVGHGETPHDLNLRMAHFRESATQYSAKRDAIREAKRLANEPAMPGQWRVVSTHGQTTVWSSKTA